MIVGVPLAIKMLYGVVVVPPLPSDSLIVVRNVPATLGVPEIV